MMQSPDPGLAVAEPENERAGHDLGAGSGGDERAELEELRRLVHEGLAKGCLSYDEIAAGLEDVDLTKDQSRRSPSPARSSLFVTTVFVTARSAVSKLRLGIAAALAPFVLVVFAVGALASYAIALREGADVAWPSTWLLIRGLAAGWLILAAWAAFGVLLAVLSRGTALAIGIGILYALVIEGLISALASQVSLLDRVVEFFLRANAYSLVARLGVSADEGADNGPGSFSGPFVDGEQALLALAAYIAAFVVLPGWLSADATSPERAKGRLGVVAWCDEAAFVGEGDELARSRQASLPRMRLTCVLPVRGLITRRPAGPAP